MNDVAHMSFSYAINKAIGSIFFPYGNTEEQETSLKANQLLMSLFNTWNTLALLAAKKMHSIIKW